MVTTQVTEGAQVFAQLQEAVRVAGEVSQRLRDDLRRLDNEMSQLVADRGDALVQLARHYLPKLTPEEIESTIDGIRDKLRSVLARKRRREQELAGEIASIRETRHKLEQTLQALTSQLNEKVARRETLEREVAERLKQHEELQRLSEQALLAERQLSKDETRVEEIRGEAAEKLPSYEHSRLFQYLYQRRFGLADYKYRGLTRQLDRWVARLIDYKRARRSYDFLRATPEFVAHEVERRREEFQQHMARIEDIEASISAEMGLADVLREGERLGSQRDETIETLNREQQRSESLEEELLSLEHSQGDYYDEAIDRFKSFLNSAEVAELDRHASTTPQPDDDQIVVEVRELNSALNSIKQRIESLGKDRQEADRQLHGLEYVVGRFQQRDYDSSRSYFPAGFDLDEPIQRFARGEINRRSLWREIGQDQKFRPTWLENSAAATGEVLDSPAGHLIVHAIVQAAAPHLSDAVGGVLRRGGSGRKGGSGKGGGGFTSGRGF